MDAVIIWVGSILFGVLLVVRFQLERQMLAKEHARTRAEILDAARLLAAMLMFLALPVAEPKPLATLGLGLAVFAFVAVPSTWAISLGGLDPRWELRQLQSEGAELMAHYSSPPPAEGAERLRAVMAGLARVRVPETAELCDLLTARYSDWIDGSYRPLALGRRVIRIYDLERRTFPDETRLPPLSQDEATFRWRLYRIFGELVECAASGAGSHDDGAAGRQHDRCQRLLRELEAYRRPDTTEFIDSLEASVRAWLNRPEPRPAGHPAANMRQGAPARGRSAALWPDTAVFWGAILDEGDRAQLRLSLTPG